MTPIQQHEQELRTMMERAGLTTEVRVGPRSITGVGTHSAVTVYTFQWVTSAVTHAPNGDIRFGVGSGVTAEHPDPRIALRHCLEMAGLIEDRPPQTDAELVRWLVERWGEAETLRPGEHGKPPTPTGAMVWSGQRVSCDYIRSDDRRWYYAGNMLTARELGAILWCGERWPPVSP